MEVFPETKTDGDLLYLKKKIWLLDKEQKEANHKILKLENKTPQVFINRHDKKKNTNIINKF